MKNIFSAILVTGFMLSSNAFALSHVGVNFGNVFVNSRSTQIYTVTNDGPTPLKMLSFQIGGAFFDADENGCELIPAQGQCQVEIAFWPAFAGFQIGELYLQFDHDEIVFDLAGWANR